MYFDVVRSMKMTGYRFAIKYDGILSGKVNYTLGIGPRIITVKNADKTEYVLKQRNILLNILEHIPIVGLEIFSPFILYRDGNKIGRIRHKIFSSQYYLTTDNDTYEIFEHSNNYISITRNETQIALIKKEEVTEFEHNTYRVKYDNKEDKALLFALCMMIDVVMYEQHLKVSMYKREKVFIIDDKYSERAYWSTKDEIEIRKELKEKKTPDFT